MLNWYEERKKRRIQLYLKLSEKNDQLANQYQNSPYVQAVRDLMGEPIKIGHHSEKRHRKLIERADRDMQKAVEHWRKAQYYREKAEAVANNRSISSDDPQAIEKLEEKLRKLKEQHEYYKWLNKEYRKAKGNIDLMQISEED